MVKKRFCRILVLTVFAALFVFALACTAYAEETDPVIYDAAEFSNLSGRTQEDVMEKYTQAQAEGTTYVRWAESTFYETPASFSVPYAAGVLNPDTLKAMKGMTNFYRWLIGVEDLSVNTESNASLQAQAFDRNYEFDHYISNDSKPADMDDALWQEGFNCAHNILASGSLPADAVTSWLNEGYSVSTKEWGTIGHRLAILDAGYKNISYGYSGRVGIGKCGSRGNTFENAFAAFPAAGYMPAELLSARGSAWTVELNTSILKVSSADNVVVTVKNLTTGNSYTCKNSDKTAQNSSHYLVFMQPQDQNGWSYSDSYQVTATGLTDVATGKAAEITYTVRFFTPPTVYRINIPQEKYAYTGSQIKPEATVLDGKNKTITDEQNYTLRYYNNVEEGIGIIEARGIGDYCGTAKQIFSIEVDRKDMQQCYVYAFSEHYTGKEVTPKVKVNSFGKTLTEGTDYTVSFRDNIYPGTGVAIVSGIGEYSGSVEKPFRIYKGEQSITGSVPTRRIEVGGTAKITASAREDAPISFTSSDESIATVDADGTVHGVDDGSVTITIKAEETDHYYSSTSRVTFSISRDYHTMVEKEVVYADENNDTASITEECSVCGKKETTSFTTMREFSLWYKPDTDVYGYPTIDADQKEGNGYRVFMRYFRPEDAQDQTYVLESSDPAIMTVDGDSFKFVRAGTVTLTVYAKYRPSAKFTKTFKVSHIFDGGLITRQPTCSVKGEKVYTCLACGDTKTEDINTIPHTWNDGEVTEPANCTEHGEKTFTCVVCGGEKTEPTPLDPTAHNWDEGIVTTEPKCFDAGVRTFTCTRCGDKRTEAVEQIGYHTPGEERTENEKQATCTENGSYDVVVRCTVCDAVLESETFTTDALGHDDQMEYTAANPVTCTADGNAEYWHCSKCGKYFSDGKGEQLLPEGQRVILATGHKWDAGKITTVPTATKTGVKTFTCTVCGTTKELILPTRSSQVAADGTKVGPGASEEVANQAITGMKNDADPAGSTYGLLKAKSVKQGKTSVKVTWSKVKGAKKYVVYGNACGKSNKMKKLATVTGSSYTAKKIINNKGKKVKVKKGTYYKFIIVALDGNRNVVSTSKVIHAATKGGKVGNDKSVSTKAKKNKVTVKVKKTFVLKAKAVPVSKKMKVKKHRSIAFESSDKTIATVSARGVITGKRKGTCYVYAYAQNGVSKKITVTVK